jgi:5-methylcytosine-specific restriction protein A
MLSTQATNILSVLVASLPGIVPGSPETYLGYKEVHDRLKLAQEGPTYGESLKRQGLEELANWTFSHGYPGITGLIIDKTTFQPGDGYFRVFGKKIDFTWWADEVRKATKFDWSSIETTRGSSTSDQSSTTELRYEIPLMAEYLIAFRTILPTAHENHIKMLRAHFLTKERTITATELANSVIYRDYSAANLQYGIFAKSLCASLRFQPPIGNSGEPTSTYVLATPIPGGHGHDLTWKMREPVAKALEEIWGQETVPTPIHSDELPDDTTYLEGAVQQVLVNRYERDQQARQACLDYWGYGCYVCLMNFEEVYGIESGRGIHVHHLLPIFEIKAEYKIDPVHDLRPVCPNCHAALHSQDPPIKPDVLRKQLKSMKASA